ncbi:undecaprenyldiphospho-muramoylpentapeptide beta-N-acetylglucosaminyltransferase [Elizabethkingia argentiflava]|uniref:UDP-N-acetylglucosamine--N-acetylmuramyl-(pentapeptide) pyrophosphoryl-undecaprenol N-acetylglucosamine transferase n=1 Tax=Elizabethkingia argenteiflava TaxID=2681556 RepID=A0A845PVP5_9FLAO|nr:undecaprenyldiphospho-muramoylpentapeptide beta-N-acetylglucosaminyltransferase [Elizabethkingia argenteiflava]NAW52292.1 undecaprenyldiphospho-muramoylpentapeptide beta-N-acetylglucosaminyltransferase [Elizabethkingia argenteiflava]
MISPRVILSGGGTGGHIFPAISIAEEIQKRYPKAEFLFIGALSKMEMEKIPQAGFRVEGLDIAGFDRGNILSNFKLPFRLLNSLFKVRKIIKNFKPDFAVGTGGYASGPALWTASRMGVPIFIQEQNSFPGITNKILSKKAKAIFTAYPDMEHFFPKTEVKFLGNPVRQNIVQDRVSSQEAKKILGLKDNLTILSVGGSQGSRTLNIGWKDNLDKLKERGYQLIWQTGKLDYASLNEDQQISALKDQVFLKEFIGDMGVAYAAADVIVSRAGAIAISELALAVKPMILVPLPTAAEDHQTKNAQRLVERGAAFMVKDVEMKDKFWQTLESLCEDQNLREEMKTHVMEFGKPEATKEIADEIFKSMSFNNASGNKK